MARRLAEEAVKKELDSDNQTQQGLLFHSTPSFFKVLIGDYSEKLRIPSIFARKCLGKCERLELETYRGTWTVMVAKSCKGGYFFEKGWAAFVRANDVEFGEFLVFFLTGSCALSVVMYNKTACARNYSLSSTRKKIRISNSDEPTAEKCGGHSYELCVTLKKYNKYNMALQKKFFISNGLAQMSKIEIFNQDGRSWVVLVRNMRRLGPGWTRFWIENNLAPGDKCMFKCTRDTEGENSKIEFLKLDGEAGKGKA